MRVVADKYYGKEASGYDAAREHSKRWEMEDRAVSMMVDAGPVLDVPLGTGRFIPIYRRKSLTFTGLDVSADMRAVARQKYGSIDAHLGSVLEIPFPDKSFGTAVCTRLMDWLCPDEMEKAFAELRRVSDAIIVTLRHGHEGISINYTHSLSRFYAAIDGLFIAARETTEITKHGHEEIFKLRAPVWRDVLDQFRWHGANPHAEIERIAGREVNPEQMSVTSEYWPADRIGQTLDGIGGLDKGYANCPEPRYMEGAPVVLRVENQSLILDGQRRFHLWRKSPGLHPVLVISQG